MSLSAQEFKSDSYLYRQLSDTSAAIIGALADGHGIISIPSHIKKNGKRLTVTTVGYGDSHYNALGLFQMGNPIWKDEYVIKRAMKVTSVLLPNTIEEIKPNALRYLNIKTIELPNHLKKIGDFAFHNSSLTSIVIPPSVTYIGDNCFDECKDLREIVIPNSVTTLGRSFLNNCYKLVSVTVPDRKPNEIGELSGYDLHQSANLAEIKGNSVANPSYFITKLWCDKKCPWAKNVLPRLRSSFTFFAQDKASELMEKWQQQKPYETISQYQARMSDESRHKHLDEIVIALRQEYVKKRTSSDDKPTLGAYDAYYNAFPVTIHGVTTYANVPRNEALTFKDNWGKVSVSPQYGIRDDQFAILSCTFMLNGKTYQSVQTYSNDDASSLMSSITLMDFDIKNAGSSSEKQKDVPAIDDVDINIPVSVHKNDKTFAVVIGNENYQRVAKVEYASNDAKVFAAYCQKTLGIPAQNIRMYNDATYGTVISALQDIKEITNAYDGETSIIFYYAGHGIPNETDHEAYLLPVDADGHQTKACLSLSQLYSSLGNLKAKNVVVFLDACFSGSLRGDGMLASARGVAIKPKTEMPEGNVIVFSAASNDETAFSYKDKRHGLFTYYLLKELQQTKGKVTLGDLSDYITKNVRQQAIVINRKPQTPTTASSSHLASVWQSLRL